MPYLGVAPNPRENREVDDISSGFNGGTTQFTLQVAGSNVSPGKASAIIVSLGGVVQNPGTDYTIAASTITFTTAPASGLSFFGVVLAQSIDIETVADNTVTTSKIVNDAVTADKLAHTSVTAGSYTTADITVDAQGRITAAASGTISGAEIADQAVTNAKINNSAAIAGTKISPDFGAQGIVSTGNLTVGTGTFSGDITIPDKIIHAGDVDTAIRLGVDTFSVETAGSEGFRLDSGGRLLINMTTNVTGGKFQVNAGANFFAASNDANGVVVQLEKTRSTSPGSYTIVQDGDTLGELRYRGSNGSGSVIGANIQAVVNGTPGSGNDLPTDLIFRLMPDGSGSTVERMRIKSDGFVGIGTSSPNKTGIQNGVSVLQVDSGDGAELILGNSQSTNVSTNHIGAIAFKNIDDSTGNAPHYAGIRSNCTDTSGSMDLKFYAGSTEFEANTPHMTINATGIIGVGDDTTSPASDCLLQLRKNSNTAYDVTTAVTNPLLTLRNGNSGTNHCVGIAFNGTSNNGEAYITLVGASSSESNLFIGMRNGSQRRVKVAIERTGRVVCGTSGVTSNTMGGQVEVHGAIGFNDTGIGIKTTSTDVSSRSYMQFRDSSNNTRGSIGMGSSSVSFNTSSDYRLKENVVAISDGITRLKTLKPSRFNFKSDTSKTVDGFLAHEVTAVPEAVSGTKDEMKAETLYEEGDTIPSDKKIGDPKTYSSTEIQAQQLDYSKLTPLLTAALQEAIAKIETLETKVAALEAA